QALYRFTWNEFCDWYIEVAKVLLDGPEADRAETLATLTATFEILLRLLHPLIPFVTEELWHELPSGGRMTAAHAGASGDPLLMTASYPEENAAWRSAASDTAMETVIEIVRSVRNIRA